MLQSMLGELLPACIWVSSSQYHLVSTEETQTHFPVGLSQKSNLDSICYTTVKCIPESSINDLGVTCCSDCLHFVFVLGTENLDLVYGLTYPPLLFCVHSERCFFAGLCAYMYLSFLLQAWYLDFFFQNVEIYKMQKYLYPSG